MIPWFLVLSVSSSIEAAGLWSVVVALERELVTSLAPEEVDPCA
jgi:hypothetical protein